MSIRPVDMQIMVQNTLNTQKSSMQKVENNSALAQQLSEDFGKKIEKVVDQKIDMTKNEKDVKNRFEEKRNKKKRRKKEKDKQEEKKKPSVHLDLSV